MDAIATRNEEACSTVTGFYIRPILSNREHDADDDAPPHNAANYFSADVFYAPGSRPQWHRRVFVRQKSAACDLFIAIDDVQCPVASACSGFEPSTRPIFVYSGVLIKAKKYARSRILGSTLIKKNYVFNHGSALLFVRCHVRQCSRVQKPYLVNAPKLKVINVHNPTSRELISVVLHGI